MVPTHFALAETFWEKITSWGAGALSAVADFGMDLILTPFVWLAYFVNLAANTFMLAMGYILDKSIDYTINSDIYKSVSAIQVGWTAVRDFSNMFFIFVLLYIAILTILGMAGSSTKRWVAHLIIAALLINFSLFFTQVVVDAGNILALGFWNKMITTQGPASGSSASIFFMEGFRVQTEFDSLTDSTGKKIIVTKSSQIMIYLGGAAVSFVGGYVFLAGAIMMIIRSVTLMILMIASPFAFLGFALPKGGGFAQQWFDKLIGATFMAPAFIFMLYIDMLIIRGTGAGGELIKSSGADKGKLAMAFAGQITDFSVIYNFVLMVILLLASLTVAQKVSGGVGSAAGGLAKKAIGYGGAAAAATGAFSYRNSLARRATNKLNDKDLQARAKLDGKPGIQARAQLEKYERQSKRTGDIRNSTVGKYMGAGLGMVGVSMGKGTTTTGYNRKEAVEKQEDDEIAKAKRLFPDNPEAQQKYLQERLGVNQGIAGGPGIYKVGNKDKDLLTRFGANKNLQTAYGEGRHKKMGEALDAEAKKKAAADALEKQPGEYNALKQKVADLETEKQRLEEKMNKGPLAKTDLDKLAQTESDLSDTNKDLKKSLDEFTDNLKQVGTKHFSEMDMDASTPEGQHNRDFVKSELFNKNAAPEYAKSLESRDDLTRDDLKEIRESGLANGSERMKEFYKKQMRNEDSRHYVDHKENVKQEVGDLEANVSHQKDMTEVDRLNTMTGPLSPAEQAQFAAVKTRVKDGHKDIATHVGYMAADDVAKLDQKTLENPSVISVLTPRMLQEIGRREKDYPGSFNKEFFEDIAARIKSDPNSDPKSITYIQKVETNNSKDSPFAAKYWV